MLAFFLIFHFEVVILMFDIEEWNWKRIGIL